MQNHASTLAAEFKLDAARVAATVALIDEGNTIPFIARYRKEATGSMDDQTLRALDERLSYLRKLDDQKETVHNSITAAASAGTPPRWKRPKRWRRLKTFTALISPSARPGRLSPGHGGWSRLRRGCWSSVRRTNPRCWHGST